MADESSYNHRNLPKNKQQNILPAFLSFWGRLFLLVWNFPLLQFLKIVGVYGSILDFIGYTFFNLPLSYEIAAALGLSYYLVFFEIPLLWRPEKPTKLRAITKEVKPTTTRERGRENVEEATGKEVKR